MPRRQLRSRSLRKLKRVVPSGRVALRFERRVSSVSRCSACRKGLSGKPNRPFGGNLCPSCLKKKIKNSV